MKVDPKVSEQLRSEFQSWRAVKRYSHQKIPPALLAKAKEYADQFGSSEARKDTGLLGHYFCDDREAGRTHLPEPVNERRTGAFSPV